VGTEHIPAQEEDAADTQLFFQRLAETKQAAVALALGPARLMGTQPIGTLAGFSSTRHNKGAEGVITLPSQEVPGLAGTKQQRAQGVLIEPFDVRLSHQLDVLDSVQPLLAHLPHIALPIRRALHLASTALLAGYLGRTTTELHLHLYAAKAGEVHCTLHAAQHLQPCSKLCITIDYMCRASTPVCVLMGQ
jgi:hypothetical protein